MFKGAEGTSAIATEYYRFALILQEPKEWQFHSSTFIRRVLESYHDRRFLGFPQAKAENDYRCQSLKHKVHRQILTPGSHRTENIIGLHSKEQLVNAV